MRKLADAVQAVARVMHWLGGVFLIGMMGIVIADIVARSVFGATDGAVDFAFPGSIELVSYGLMFTILFAFPYAVSRGQVIVDMFTENLDDRIRSILDGFYVSCFGFLGAVMTYRLFEDARRVAMTGETTQDLLIPMTYIYGTGAVATAMLTLRAAMSGLQKMITGRGEGPATGAGKAE